MFFLRFKMIDVYSRFLITVKFDIFEPDMFNYKKGCGISVRASCSLFWWRNNNHCPCRYKHSI